jgi:HD-GYP domain-containing protein (c-di-GMP phosphodiesterase class II)
MVARRLGLAAVIIGIVAGGASYLLEMHRVERAALAKATKGAQHFQTAAIKVAIGSVGPEEHATLYGLLDSSRFIAIRLFGPDRKPVQEYWADISPNLRTAVSAGNHSHAWPAPGESHKKWIDVSGERLIQVVLPLFAPDGTPVGYLEGINRLDRQTLQEQQEQILKSVLTAVLSVMVTAFLLYPLLLSMLRQTNGLSLRLLDANLSLMRSLGNAIAKRDSDTDTHNYRVTYYAVKLAESMCLPEKEIPDLIVGAFLHDVGKIGIPDRILLKPGKLTPDEFDIMKTHSLLGIEIVADNPWLKGAALTIRHHHERFDGTGYPDSLSGSTIPLCARIFAVVDVFDALTSARPYKLPMTLSDAMRILEQGSGFHFDPQVLGVFKSIAPTLYADAVQAGDVELRQGLRNLLNRHVKVETAR